MKSILFFTFFLIGCCRCAQVTLEPPCSYIEERECIDTDEEILLTFWNEFNDPLLTYFIEVAFCENRDFLIAQERVVEARGAYIFELSKLLPQVDAFFSAQRERNSLTSTDIPVFQGGLFFNLFEAGLLANWEIDFFGKRRDRARAAYYDIATLAADKFAVKLLIASEIATNYIAAAAAFELITINKKHVKLEEELHAIAEDRYKSGLTNEKDVCNAKAQLEQRRASIYLNEILAKQNIYAIATLMGVVPEKVYCYFCEELLIPDAPGNIPCSVPSDLLARRPDIIAAEYLLMAQGARVSAAKKELFPTINLLGFYAVESSFLNLLFRADSRNWLINPVATMPIFHGGGIYADIAVATSRQRQAVYNYEKTILQALQDVETSMALYFEERSRLEHLNESIVGARCALEISVARYQAGLIDFRDVMEDERDLHNAQILGVESKKNLMIALVSIYKSLGGGWDWSCLP